jgi:hypothetical protein
MSPGRAAGADGRSPSRNWRGSKGAGAGSGVAVPRGAAATSWSGEWERRCSASVGGR